MSLTHQQKRFIKKNIRNLSVIEISEKINLTPKEIHNYLKDKWSKEKYKKYEKFAKLQSGKVNKTNMIDNRIDFKLLELMKKKLAVFIILTLLVIIVYANSLNNAFVSDDIDGIVRNPNFENFNYILKDPFHFIGSFFRFITKKLFLLNPIPYHITSILFHLGNVYLVYLILSLISLPLTALITASIFAVHPILTEAVTWISGIQYVQYTFFCLLSFLFYLKISSNRKYWLTSLMFYILAMSSSEKAIIFPVILLTYNLIFFQGKQIRYIAPYFLIAFVAGFYLLMPHSGEFNPNSLEISQQRQAANINYFVKIPLIITSYLSLISWPDKLTLYHTELAINQLNNIIRFIVFAGLLGGIGFFYRKNKLLCFWLCFFIISLGLSLTPISLGWLVAERYVYFGSIGIIFFVGYGLTSLINIRRFKILGYLLFISIIISLSVRTIIRNNDWQSADNLWLAAARTSPNSSQNHNNLGDYYSRKNDWKNAIKEFKTAIKIDPQYADAYHNLALAYAKSGNIKQAEKNYKMAVKYNANLWPTYQSLAIMYYNQKKYDLAAENFETAMKINPKNVTLLLNAATMYIDLNQEDKAKELIIKALVIDPNNQKGKSILKEININIDSGSAPSQTRLRPE